MTKKTEGQLDVLARRIAVMRRCLLELQLQQAALQQQAAGEP